MIKRIQETNMINYNFEFGKSVELPTSVSDYYPRIDKLEDKFKHTYLIGKTGTGKSTLMETMAHYDLIKGLSVIYIDPKGDSVNKLYDKHRGNTKVRYVSFQKPYQLKINPLNKRGYNLDDIITEFSQIMDILITRTSPNPEMTVRMKEIISYAIRGLSDEYRFSKDIFKILYEFLFDPNKRKQYVSNFKNKDAQYWWKEIDNPNNKGFKVWGDFNLTMSSLSSRLSQFIHNDQMKDFILGENELYIEDLVEDGCSLLVNTYTPSIDNNIFLSNLIVYSVYSYIHQQRVRKPLIIYIDEFQTCASELFPWLLLKSRSYQVGFVLAHQNFTAISPSILSAIFGVSNTFVVFRCGDEEAKRFSTYFDVSVKDLLMLPDYCAYVLVGNEMNLIQSHPPLTASSVYPASYNFLGDNWIKML